jgi:hypothetical protein
MSTLGEVDAATDRDYFLVVSLMNIFFIFFMIVLMLNLLIAVMTDGYAKVQSLLSKRCYYEVIVFGNRRTNTLKTTY